MDIGTIVFYVIIWIIGVVVLGVAYIMVMGIYDDMNRQNEPEDDING